LTFTNITNFAEDNFIVVWNKIVTNLIEKELEMITKWLKDSGLQVNLSKTEICMFLHNDKPPVTMKLLSQNIVTKKSMKVLGVIFDSKLSWNEQVLNAIKKATKFLFAVKMIKRYFGSNELKILLDSFFFSVLYYNSEIWLLPTLKSGQKQQLLSASAKHIADYMTI
jgi:hypothetical protein